MLKFDFDHYREETMDGKRALEPSVVCVQRGRKEDTLVHLQQRLMNLGTPIPSALALWREGISRFSLQPSKPIEIESE